MSLYKPISQKRRIYADYTGDILLRHDSYKDNQQAVRESYQDEDYNCIAYTITNREPQTVDYSNKAVFDFVDLTFY